MRGRIATTMLLLCASTAAMAKKPPTPPCPPGKAQQLFLSPMGEPFRAAPGEPYPVALWFAGADADHDGKLTQAEAAADAGRFFARLDTDHDGEISPEEVIAYEANVAPELRIYGGGIQGAPREGPPKKRRDKDLGAYGGAMGAGRWAFLNIPQPVAAADMDVNRLVSRDEFLQAAKRRFVLIDTAGRGAIALADLPKTPAEQAALLPCPNK